MGIASQVRNFQRKVTDKLLASVEHYRRKKWLKCLIYKSRRPKNVQKSKFGVEVYNLVKQIRAENRTYGKAKICVILRNVGGIMKRLRFSRSRSALRCKKKRGFDKYTKPFKFKKYDKMAS